MNPAPPVIRHRMADWPCTSHARRLGRILPTRRCRTRATGVSAAPGAMPQYITCHAAEGGRHGGTISSVCGAARRAPVRRGGSPPAAPQQHHRRGTEHDSEIFEHGLAPDVLEVVAHLAAHVAHRRVVALVDLCPARDARPNALAALLALDLLAEVH